MTVKLKVVYAVFSVFMLSGFIAWIYQLDRGLAVTNMGNSYSWGLYIAGFAFFVGNAAGGMVLSASIYLFGLKHLKPFAKLGAFSAFANVIAAMLSVIVDVGQPSRVLNMLLHPNFSSPIIWDVIVLNIYALLTLIYLYILMLPDLKKFAVKVDDPAGFSDTWAKRLAPVAMIFAAGIHVVTAWIFSTQGAREWWHSPALAPDFVSVAVAAGTTVVLLFSALLYGIDENNMPSYKTMIKFIGVAFTIHLFLMYNDFFIKAWYGSEEAMKPILITLKEYGLVHGAEVGMPLIGIIILIKAIKSKKKAPVVLSAILILSGILAHRFLLLPAAFNAVPLTFEPFGLVDARWSYPIASGRYMEGQDTFVTNWNYIPSITEILIFLGLFSLMSFLITFVTTHIFKKAHLKGHKNNNNCEVGLYERA